MGRERLRRGMGIDGVLVSAGRDLREGNGKVVMEMAVREFIVCLMGRVHASLVTIFPASLHYLFLPTKGSNVVYWRCTYNIAILNTMLF